MLRNLTLLSLFVHLASLAATQTAYGTSFSMLRWLSLIALAAFGGLYWATSPQRHLRLESVSTRVLIYLGLWGLTVINAENPLFSSYRWAAHAMIVMAGLVFLPRVPRMRDVYKLLWALKLIVGVILVLSYFRPVELTMFDDANLYKGIFGSPNALGHMSAVGCLLFLHGFLSQRGTWWGQLQGAMAVLAGLLLIQSGARSSVLAFLGGFLVLYMFYKSRLSRYAMLGIVVAAVALAVSPDLPKRAGDFVLKHGGKVPSGVLADRLMFSRQTAWESHWEGFNDRPLLGWGFGLDKDSDFSGWNGELTALGVVGRDPVNDVMYTLESGGVVGLFAYVFILALIVKAWIPGVLRTKLDARLRRPGYELLASVYEVQKAFCSLAVLLIVLFQWDNTALAAGNFFAALLWVSLGLSLGLYAMLMHSLRHSVPEPASLQRPAAARRWA